MGAENGFTQQINTLMWREKSVANKYAPVKGATDFIE